MRYLRKMMQWLAALMAGFCFVNLLCFGYERPAGWLDTPNGPSPAGWNPGAVLIHGSEGYGIAKVDENGYLNPDGVLQENYILCMGSSHTGGKEVASDKKYTSLLNAYFSQGEGQLAAYNIACDGNYLPSLIKHFSAAMDTFPDAGTVIIEIFNTDFSSEEIQSSMEQVSYDEKTSARNQKQSLGVVQKAKILIKEYFPLLALIKSKLETMQAGEGTSVSEAIEDTQQADTIRDALQMMRQAYAGEMIFLYHPSVTVSASGEMSCVYDDFFDTFQNLCEENSICVIDMGDAFLENYQKENTLPYGFMNTAPGVGHLNATGHRLIAEALIEKIQGR